MNASSTLLSETKIRILDAHTVNKIAAGEVVERPASVIKELVENAHDAGATRIEIELIDYGRASIEVADDGCGMDGADALACLQRHATSKIRRVEDLSHVLSLGFRGEAIPSIASVSRLTLSTGEQDGLRHVLHVEPGKDPAVDRDSGPRGTTVRVEELFFNTPARLKFLKSDATEMAACVECASKYALARPEVALTLKHNGSTLLTTAGSDDLQTAISEVWGRDVARGLCPIDSFVGGVRVRGYASPPHFTKPTRAYQWVFVNGRPIRSKTLNAAIDQAYRALTPERRYPVVVLMIDVDPSRVDANVSPTKNEVRFQSEGQLFDAVRHAIKSALLEQGMVPSAEELAIANAALMAAQPWMFSVGSGGASPVPGWPQAPLGLGAPFAVTSGGDGELAPGMPFGDFLDGLRVLGQAMGTFVIAENASGLLIVDQHVAHERILYERLLATRGSTRIERQPLLAPETIHLDRASAESVSERLGELSEIGFELEPFGGESFLVRAVPAAIRSKNPLGVLRDLMDELAGGLGQGCLKDTRDEIFILCSCKMAIKAGDPLTHDEMEKLLYDLAQTENPYLCPHGRPITLVLHRGDLWRKFKRT